VASAIQNISLGLPRPGDDDHAAFKADRPSMRCSFPARKPPLRRQPWFRPCAPGSTVRKPPMPCAPLGPRSRVMVPSE